MSGNYQIVQLANGARSIRSLVHGETFHPVIGPVAEAEALYIHQLRLRERFGQASSEFVVWDVGLGAAANPVTLLNALDSADNPGKAQLRIISFDCTVEPLRFALQNTDLLPYLKGFEDPLSELMERGRAEFSTPSGLTVYWELHLGDFPSLLNSRKIKELLKPHAIFYDAFSPAKNAAMWTLPVFAALFRQLDPMRACSMPTYSRSTLLRVTLLLAGFFVGRGHATGEKEETTIAANSRDLIDEPLDHQWLARARRSRSAEPLHQPTYTQAPLSDVTWKTLQQHPQFLV